MRKVRVWIIARGREDRSESFGTKDDAQPDIACQEVESLSH